MAMKLPQQLQDWVDARKRFRLSDAHVQMARELGMDPKKLGKLDNHRQEPWKTPLPRYVERLYAKNFGRHRPELVMSIEQRAYPGGQKRVRKEVKRERRADHFCGRADSAAGKPE